MTVNTNSATSWKLEIAPQLENGCSLALISMHWVPHGTGRFIGGDGYHVNIFGGGAVALSLLHTVKTIPHVLYYTQIKYHKEILSILVETQDCKHSTSKLFIIDVL